MLKNSCQICQKTFYAYIRTNNKLPKFCSWKCLCVHRKLNTPSGVNSHRYLGEKGGYHAKHWWVVKHLGKPRICALCKNSSKPLKQYHWANISEKYKRDLSDWVRLCHSCHKRFDYGAIALRINGVFWRRNHAIPKIGVTREQVGSYVRYRPRYSFDRKKIIGGSFKSFASARREVLRLNRNQFVPVINLKIGRRGKDGKR